MSSGSGSNNGGGVQSIPPASRKIVENLKEIVNCPELEIYATLKDCNMDPNEAVNRLLSLDPFHEVKNKRDKKKEAKDLTETKSRGASTSSRGPRGGVDSYVGHVGSAHFGSSEPSSASQGNLAYKKENGTNSYTTSSLMVSGVALNNTYQCSPTFSNSVTIENKTSNRSAVEDVSASQTSSSYQPAWVGVPGRKSLADIVKMGVPQSKASNTLKSSHCNVNHVGQVPQSTDFYHDLSSEYQHSKVKDLYDEPGAAPNEWPLMEPPQGAKLSKILESCADSQLRPDRSDLPYDRTSQHLHSEPDEFGAEEEGSFENLNGNHDGFATISSRAQNTGLGDASLYDNDMYTNLDPYQSYNYALQNEEEDVGASVLSETANMQQLSIQEECDPSYEESGPSVVIPDHLQVQTADCSHLSFGTFGSGLGTGFSGSRSSRSNMAGTPIGGDADAPLFGKINTIKPDYYREESILSAADENLVSRTSGVAGSFDSLSASQSEFFTQESPEVAHGRQYTFTSPSTGYPFENSQQLNSEFNDSHTSSQMQNLVSLSGAMQAYTHSLSSSLSSANVHPAQSELQYSPFPVTQSMTPKYGKTVSSISDSSISVEEALKTGFQSVHPTPQNHSGGRVATGHSLSQHLALHQYSQPTLPLGHFANIIGYPYLSQSYPYTPSSYQQAFAGNSTYHQTLADILPQYKSSVSVSSLSQSFDVPSGYGNFGNSTDIPGNYAMNPAAVPTGSTIRYDDLLRIQYKDSNHLVSHQQQNENSAMWLHGHGSRTMSAGPASTYYSLQGQNQQPGGLRKLQQPSLSYEALGNANFYNSQTVMPLEHQLQNLRDGSLGGSQLYAKQPQQQIWQNGY